MQKKSYYRIYIIRAIEELKLPSEMIQDLKGKSLTEDEQGSIEFLATYREKVKDAH